MDADLIAPFRRFAMENLGPYRVQLVLVLALSLIAYGFIAFSLTLAGDDWEVLMYRNFQYDWVVQIGRWIERYIWQLLGNNRFAPAFTLGAMVVLLASGACLAARTIGLKDNYAAFGFIACFVLFPLWAESVSFKMNHATVGISAFMSCIYGSFAVRAFDRQVAGTGTVKGVAKYTILGAIFFSLAASAHQAAVPFGAMIFLLAVVNRLLTRPNVYDVGASALAGALIGLTVIVLGSLLYFVEVSATQSALNISSPKGHYALLSSVVSSPGELKRSLWRFGRYFTQFITGDQHLLPWASKLLFLWSLLVFLSAAAGTAIAYRAATLKKAALLVIVLIAIAMVAVAPWVLGIVRVPNSYRYDGIVATCLLYAGIVALAIERSDVMILRSSVQLCAVALALIFVFEQASASVMLKTVNVRDFFIAERLLTRMEYAFGPQLTDAPVVTIITVGHLKLKRGRPFNDGATTRPMDKSIVSCGIFNCQVRRLGQAFALIQSTGTQFRVFAYEDLSKKMQGQLKTIIDSMPRWPAANSIRRTSERKMVIKLGLP